MATNSSARFWRSPRLWLVLAPLTFAARYVHPLALFEEAERAPATKLNGAGRGDVFTQPYVQAV